MLATETAAPPRHSSPATFTWPLARELAGWADAAYHRSTCADPATDAHALVDMMADGQNIVIAFRGSCAPRDFLQDAKCERRRLRSGPPDTTAEAHLGFLEDYAAISESVCHQINDLLAVRPGAQIFVTGHSLGGALAILCALELRLAAQPVAAVITFGQPRVGNAAFAALYDNLTFDVQRSMFDVQCSLRDITFRIVNQNDLIPRVPGALMGYRHCGQEIFLPPTEKVLFNPSLFNKSLWDLIGLCGAWLRREEVLLRDHFLSAYQEKITHL